MNNSQRGFGKKDVLEIITVMVVVCLFIALATATCNKKLLRVSACSIILDYTYDGNGYAYSATSSMGIKRKNSPKSTILKFPKENYLIKFRNIKKGEIFEIYQAEETPNCFCWKKIGEIRIK